MVGDAGPQVPLAQEPALAEVEALVRTCIEDLAPVASAPRPGRPAILPATCLWAGLLVCVLQGFSSQLALWRLLTQVGLWTYPRYAVSDQAVYHRLARDGAAPLEALFQRVSALLHTRLTPLLPALGPDLAPFASDIVVLDESTLDPLARRLPARDGAPPVGRHLPGTLAGLFDIRRQQWRTLWVRRAVTQNEKVLARALVAALARGSLILADLGYFGFQWFDDLTDAGHWWISRCRAKTSYRIVHVHAHHGDTLDALIWLGTYRADRAKHLVRLIQVRHGGQLRRYITNVRDPDVLSAQAILDLYARRWDIECAINLVKTHLGLHLWWSSNEVVIHQQLWAALTIAQILQALRLEIALRATVPVFDVSLALLVRYLPVFAQRGEDPIAVFVERGHAAGFIRPSRRIQMRAPDPPDQPAWSCGPLPIQRTPRYAGKS
jgi:hypothetical protein